MEENTIKEKYEYTSIFRPGLLDREQDDKRTVEKIASMFIKLNIHSNSLQLISDLVRAKKKLD